MFNKTYLIGNVGQIPDVRTMQDGREIAILSIATNSSWKDKEGIWQRHTEWHRVTVFRDFYVSLIKTNVKKGDSLFIEGTLSYSEWRDKFNHKQKVAHIIVQGREGRLHLLNTRRQENLTKNSSIISPLKETSLSKILHSSEELSSSLFDLHNTENLNEQLIEDSSNEQCFDGFPFARTQEEILASAPQTHRHHFKTTPTPSTNGDSHENQ